ncbi:MAG: hypothetical protein Q4F72_02590 [Desulfovibrionaceae bacterium]|nr:hypothetical protein [Desulfovibrionaceae bacterium]
MAKKEPGPVWPDFTSRPFHDGPMSERPGLSAWLKVRSRRRKEQEAAALERELDDLADPGERAGVLERLGRLERAGSVYAAWVLGAAAAEGRYAPADSAAAEPLLEKAAEGGIGAACLPLARIAKEKREGVSDFIRSLIDGGPIEAAAVWLRAGTLLLSPGCALELARLRAAHLTAVDDARCRVLLGVLLMAGRAGSWPSMELALRLMREMPPGIVQIEQVYSAMRLLEQSSWAPAQLELGRLRTDDILCDRRPVRAVRAFEAARAAGSAEAACELAELLLERSPEDPAPRALLRESADAGCARACAVLGRLMYGDAYTRDEGLALMRAAAEQGAGDAVADAAWRMCLVPGADEMARDGLALLERALAAGSGPAAVRLAHLAENGLDGRPDGLDRALNLLEDARRLNCPQGAGALAAIMMNLDGGDEAGGGDSGDGEGDDDDLDVVVTEACGGWEQGDPRSMALLMLISLGLAGERSEIWNPADDCDAVGLLMHLADRDEPLACALQALLLGRLAALPDGREEELREIWLGTVKSLGRTDEDPRCAENAGRSLARTFWIAAREADMPVLRFLADTLAKSPRTEEADCAALSFARALKLERVRGIKDLAAFAKKAAESARTALAILPADLARPARPRPAIWRKNGGMHCLDQAF